MVASVRRRWSRAGLLLLALVAAAIVVCAGVAGYFNRDPIGVVAPQGAARPVRAVFFSGDMGMRFGLGSNVTAALAAQGIAVTGFSSPTAFRTHRTLAELDAAVADAVRRAIAVSGNAPLVLIGQSYGADILQTGLASLPVDLRPHVAAVILVVPGETVFFRADPSGFAYRGTPDSMGVRTARTLTWLPVTCIYGKAETDSLCPHLRLRNATIVPMPGGHFLNHDSAAPVSRVLAAIRRAVPQAFRARA